MFGLFKKKEENKPEAAAPASKPVDSGIAFYPDLIEHLVADHRRLLALYGKIKESYAQRNFAVLSKCLHDFGNLIRSHLLTENMRLYIYLQQKVASDEVNTQLVRSFRKEMDGIAKVALDFLAHYEDLESRSVQELGAFGPELEKLGGVLAERMKREEETLYPLYARAY